MFLLFSLTRTQFRSAETRQEEFWVKNVFHNLHMQQPSIPVIHHIASHPTLQSYSFSIRSNPSIQIPMIPIIAFLGCPSQTLQKCEVRGMRNSGKLAVGSRGLNFPQTRAVRLLLMDERDGGRHLFGYIDRYRLLFCARKDQVLDPTMHLSAHPRSLCQVIDWKMGLWKYGTFVTELILP